MDEMDDVHRTIAEVLPRLIMLGDKAPALLGILTGFVAKSLSPNEPTVFATVISTAASIVKGHEVALEAA